MYKHDAESKVRRCAVCRKSDSVQVGTMPLAVGMKLSNGAVVTRFTKHGTPVVRGLYGALHEEYFRDLATVDLSEAIKYGYPRGAGR